MARMIPRRIQHADSAAERRLFEALEQALPDEYTVLHHVPWLVKNPNKKTPDGEADFVVAHPGKGALVLEVKGGALRYDADEGRWFSMGREGENAIRDPYLQARESSHSLVAFLKELPGWRKRWGPIGYGVVFPDSRFVSAPLPHVKPEITIEGPDVRSPERLRERIDALFEPFENDRSEPDEKGLRQLVEALAHDVEIVQPLSLIVDEADREIIRLSDQQYRLLDHLKRNRRVAVSGPAGSGKTLIAVEKVKGLVQEGLRTLLVCFNRPLAEFLQDLPDLRSSGDLDVFTYHQLCGTMAHEAGVPFSGDRHDPATYERLPDLLAQAADCLGPRNDAIVVDEGQDFQETWWVTLEMLLTDGDRGILYVFYDDNQAIHRLPTEFPDAMFEYRLGENWRNTRQIHQAVMAFYRGDEVVPLGPDGPAVETLEVTTDGLGRELSRVLHRQVVEGDIEPADIVVLTPHSAGNSVVRGKIGQFRLVEQPSNSRDIKLSSIYRFKGLDAKVVVVCEVDRFVNPDFERLMYVACSRARSLLTVLLTSNGQEPTHPAESPQKASEGSQDD